jgi:hypothetical protein
MPTATPRQAKKVTVLDTPQVALWYYPEDRIIHHEIKQFLSGKSLRDFLRTVAGLFEQHRAEKWLSDDRRVPVIRPGDIDWGDADWFPRAASAGWKYWAIVRPEKLVGQAVMRELSEKYARHGVTSEWFNDPADALWWLQSR